MLENLLDPEGSKLPRLPDIGPLITAEIERLEALTAAQLATEVLTRAFYPEYTPGAGGLDLAGIVGLFLPDCGPERAGDTIPAEAVVLRDLLAEGVQMLEHAGLLRPEFFCTGTVARSGWVTTRLGRSALASGSVPRALGQPSVASPG